MSRKFMLIALFWPLVAGATATTHIWGPSTDVQRFKSIHLTSDLYVPVKGDSSGVRVPTVTNLGVTAGILPFEKFNLEAGVDHKTGYGTLDRYPLYGNGKMGVPEGAFGSFVPSVAAGIYDVGTKQDVTDFNLIYGKLAKTVKPIGRLSAGYFSGNEKLLVNEKGQADNNGLMAVWERTMPEISENLWLCLEYMGSRSSYGTFNFGAAWKFTDRMSVIVGYNVFNNQKLNLPDTFTFQADVDFDLARKAR